MKKGLNFVLAEECLLFTLANKYGHNDNKTYVLVGFVNFNLGLTAADINFGDC